MAIHEDLSCITRANCVSEHENTGKSTAMFNSVENIRCCFKSHLNTNYSLQSYRALENQGGPGMLALDLICPVLYKQSLLPQEEKVIGEASVHESFRHRSRFTISHILRYHD